MRRIFKSARGEDVPACRLLSTHVKDAILVGKTDLLRAPMTKLLKHPVMWLAPSLGYWSGLRMSLFKEVSSKRRETYSEDSRWIGVRKLHSLHCGASQAANT